MYDNIYDYEIGEIIEKLESEYKNASEIKFSITVEKEEDLGILVCMFVDKELFEMDKETLSHIIMSGGEEDMFEIQEGIKEYARAIKDELDIDSTYEVDLFGGLIKEWY